MIGVRRWLSPHTHIMQLWAGIETVCRLFSPTDMQKMTIKAALQTGGFDRAHYRAQLHHFPPFYRLCPLRHYAVFGESLGLEPARGFHPKAYLALNPDVADAGVPPFWHWLTKGRHERRRTAHAPLVPELPQQYETTPESERPIGQSDYAIHLHLYFAELWGEFQADLTNMDVACDLYVTLAYQGPQTAALASQIKSDFPNARVYIRHNRGRDILPFVDLLNAGLFDGYRAVCKIHGKRSLHRVDGDRWRRALLAGLISPRALRQMDAFMRDPQAGLWVADGHLMRDPKWWGENRDRVDQILARRHLKRGADCTHFAGGSMYWIKPFALGMLKSLELCTTDFEPESGQLDGTTAHAVERVVGELVRLSGQKIVQTSDLKHRPAQLNPPPIFVSAFYLPQLHEIAENNAWWGQGYTEWRAVSQSTPSFQGHDHPQHPSELGAYDLTPDVMTKQAALAKWAGVDAFCTYFYWFGGRRLLERPIDSLMKTPDAKFPFYLCWANESWRRNWDGLSGQELIRQTYSAGFEARLARDLARYFADHRYQRPDGARPRFVIYRPSDLPDPGANIAALRQAWRDLGVGEVEIGAVRFHVGDALPDDLVDFWIEMPPHGLFDPIDCLTGNQIPHGLRADFDGVIYDYNSLARRSVQPDYASALPANTIRGVMPSWDNTPRRGAQAHIAHGASPAGFRQWLYALRQSGFQNSYRGELFVNAWNEWGETAMLEPSQRYGRLNLRALRDVTQP